jgi:hypothetical protein
MTADRLKPAPFYLEQFDLELTAERPMAARNARVNRS